MPETTRSTESAERQQQSEENYLLVPGGYIWYKLVSPQKPQGSQSATPLLVLHGGPGAGSDYLASLAALADERPVVFYDQLGCGRSERPNRSSLWRIERFVAEIEAVRQYLGLEQIHLFGHSWGGWLAIEYLLTQPTGVSSTILASTSASIPEYVREIARLRSELPPATSEALYHHEQAGTLRHPDYKAALLDFYHRHLCRLEVWPSELIENIFHMEELPAYTTLQGRNEFVVNGNLRDWDRTDRLNEITVPALVTVGRYDEITPQCAMTLQEGIADARLRIFEQSSHMPHLEEKTFYLDAIRGFLNQIDGVPGKQGQA